MNALMTTSTHETDTATNDQCSWKCPSVYVYDEHGFQFDIVSYIGDIILCDFWIDVYHILYIEYFDPFTVDHH